MTDHKADALTALGHANNSGVWTNRPEIYLADAQVNATLYLAEQQRVANLIALAAHEPGNREAYFRSILSAPTGIDSLEVRPEIREALGLS